ncbi:MAG: DUF4091 domain-containing protein [Candidatus Hydrogenedentes bacterium]|nr:DUF4091 domain-containing protein [Candidatus Hydrogenedentota bacterium]
MSHSVHRWLSITLLAFVVAASATEQLAPRIPMPDSPAISVPLLDAAPSIDGVLDDAVWQDAVSVRQFNLSYESRYAPYKTEARLAYDSNNLYIGLRIADPEVPGDESLPYPPDRDPNVAEVIIAAPQEETYYKVAITSNENVLLDQPMGKTVAWRVNPSAAIHRGEHEWTAEFLIPFAGVDLPQPAPGVSWRVNIGWRTKKCTNYVAWAVTHAWFYETQFFGDVRFGGPKALTAELTAVPAPRLGENSLPVSIINRRGAPAVLETLVTVEDGDADGAKEAFRAETEVPAGASVPVAADYRLADGLTGVATIVVREKGILDPILRHSVPVDLAPNRKTLRDVQTTLAALPVELDAGLAAERQSIQVALDAARQRASMDTLSASEHLALSKELERLAGRTHKLLWRTDHPDELTGKSFAVGGFHNLRKVHREEAYRGDPVKVLTMSAARGESEGVQLMVIPLASALDALDVEEPTLTGPGGAEIPAESFEVFWTDFVESRPPRYPIDYTGWIADPLIPLAKSPRLVHAEALHQPLWLTVRVPAGIPAGWYDGVLTVRAAGGEWPVTVRLRVYDFDLPTAPALKTSMWLNPDRIKDWYGWEEISQDVLRKEMSFLFAHRLNPAWFGPLGSDEDIDWQLEQGLNLVMLGVAAQCPLSPETEQQISRFYEFFKLRNQLDTAFIYGQDEPSARDYPKVRDTLSKVAERFPGVQRVCTAYPPVPTLEGAVDTWVVGPNLFNYGPVADRVAHGDELWFYLSASVRRPYVMQLYLDYTALEHRLIGWYCWKYNATGFLYWGINEWHSNNQPWSGCPEIDDALRAGTRWPEVPWNTWTYLNCSGDAQYIYPGPEGEFWSSVRMEILRDSFEDYDYLALLREARNKLAAAKIPDTQVLLADVDALLTIDPTLISDLTVATENPTVLLRRRNAVAEMLERVNATLAQGSMAR